VRLPIVPGSGTQFKQPSPHSPIYHEWMVEKLKLPHRAARYKSVQWLTYIDHTDTVA